MFSSETNDAALLIRISGGDHVALAALYDRYGEVLLALAQHILGPSSEADELLHDVFLEVWRQAALYQPQRGTVRSWLVLKTRERALEQLRLSPGAEGHGQSTTFLPSDWAPSPKRGGDAASFEDPVFGQERSHVQHAVGALAPGMRALLEGAYFRGASEEELAERLTLAKEAVVPSLARTYHELRHSLHEGRR